MTGPRPGGQDAAEAPVGGLKRRSEFLAVAKGRRAHAAPFTLQALARAPGAAPPGARFGLTVTRRIGTATERNRIRRRLRALLRGGQIAGRADHDYVIVARRDVLDLPFDRLGQSLARLIADIDAPRGAATRKPRQGRALRDAKDQVAPQ